MPCKYALKPLMQRLQVDLKPFNYYFCLRVQYNCHLSWRGLILFRSNSNGFGLGIESSQLFMTTALLYKIYIWIWNCDYIFILKRLLGALATSLGMMVLFCLYSVNRHACLSTLKSLCQHHCHPATVLSSFPLSVSCLLCITLAPSLDWKLWCSLR